jgi:hypothetical protein
VEIPQKIKKEPSTGKSFCGCGYLFNKSKRLPKGPGIRTGNSFLQKAFKCRVCSKDRESGASEAFLQKSKTEVKVILEEVLKMPFLEGNNLRKFLT